MRSLWVFGHPTFALGFRSSDSLRHRRGPSLPLLPPPLSSSTLLASSLFNTQLQSSTCLNNQVALDLHHFTPHTHTVRSNIPLPSDDAFARLCSPPRARSRLLTFSLPFSQLPHFSNASPNSTPPLTNLSPNLNNLLLFLSPLFWNRSSHYGLVSRGRRTSN